METDYANCLSVGLKSLIRGTQNVYSIREIGRGELRGGKSNSFFWDPFLFQVVQQRLFSNW